MTMKVYICFCFLLTACSLPAAQPFAAMSATLPQIATSAPTTNAAQQLVKLPHSPTTNATQARCIVTAAKTLHVRSAGATSAPGVGVAFNGQALTIRSDRGAWLEIVTPGGVVGFVHSAYCK